MKCYFLSAILLTICFNVLSQPTSSDSAYYNRTLNNVIDDYHEFVGENLHLYSGSEYVRRDRSIKGFPFYQSDSFLNGSVSYEGKLYKNISLQYDIAGDDVIINDPFRNISVKLVPEKVNYFSVLGHPFFLIKSDSATSSYMGTGFYEKLYEGRMSVFAKREKVSQASTSIGENDFKYVQYNYFFIQLNNLYYPVTDKSTLLKAANDKSEELKKYIKKAKINFNKGMDEALIKVADYYNQIKN